MSFCMKTRISTAEQFGAVGGPTALVLKLDVDYYDLSTVSNSITDFLPLWVPLAVAESATAEGKNDPPQ